MKLYPDVPETISMPSDQEDEIEKFKQNMSMIADYERFARHVFEVFWCRRAINREVPLSELRQMKDDFKNLTQKITRIAPSRFINPFNVADAQNVLNWALWNVRSCGLLKTNAETETETTEATEATEDETPEDRLTAVS